MAKPALGQLKSHGEQEFQKGHLPHFPVYSLVVRSENCIRLVKSNRIGGVELSGDLLTNS